MPDATAELVINTGPIISLVAAMGNLTLLDQLYERVVVPHEVARELTVDSAGRFAAREFLEASWLEKRTERIDVRPLLSSILDPGEAAVIATAEQHGIKAVCIDESAGRRVARMAGLRVTGSLGVLLRAKREGRPLLLRDCIQRMRTHGIHLADGLVEGALRQAGE